MDCQMRSEELTIASKLNLAGVRFFVESPRLGADVCRDLRAGRAL